MCPGGQTLSPKVGADCAARNWWFQKGSLMGTGGSHEAVQRELCNSMFMSERDLILKQGEGSRFLERGDIHQA